MVVTEGATKTEPAATRIIRRSNCIVHLSCMLRYDDDSVVIYVMGMK